MLVGHCTAPPLGLRGGCRSLIEDYQCEMKIYPLKGRTDPIDFLCMFVIGIQAVQGGGEVGVI